MSEANKVFEKQEKVSGGNVSYYLLELKNKVIIECEDIIEHCDMRYASGCDFKAIWRLCKDRQGFGKPGSTPTYEADKNFYYAERDLVNTQRRIANLTGFQRLVRFVRDGFVGNPFLDPQNIIIDIVDPKRLEPYSFTIGELIEALEPTDSEAAVLTNVIVLCLKRKVLGPPRKDEVNTCHRTVYHAKRIAERERIFARAKRD